MRRAVVVRATDDWFASLDGVRHAFAIADIPLLFEAGREKDFDAVIVTLHLTWEPELRRLEELRLLEDVVRELGQIDPDVLLVGDFNLARR